MKESYNIHEIFIGMSASYSQTITDNDIQSFAKVSGDYNPIHVDELYAKESRYKKKIAHGLLSSSFFSSLFGTKLPGKGCVYASQSLEFKRPVYINDIVTATVTVTVTVTVTDINVDKKRVLFKTQCFVKKRVVIDGIAEIFIP